MNWKKWIDLLRFPVKDDKTGNFYSVAPGSWINEGISVVRQESWADENHVFKASDTKAFVWTCAVQDQGATETRRRMIDDFLDSKTRLAVACKYASEYWAFGDWIKYLNIDKPGVSANKCEYHRDMLQCSSYEQNWVSEPYRTYTRWADYGTLYGYSDHSGCAFISDYKDPPFWLQWRTIYRDQALFLLYVRATLFRFSRAISSITQKRVTDGDAPWAEKRFKEEFRTLRQQFVYFANLYQFPLLSTEQQGLEMYKAQREALDIDSLYKEVQSQIDNAHSYAALKSQEDTVDLTATITVLGIPLLLAGLVAALLGMDLSVHYEAIRDFIGSYGEEDFFASFSTAEGPYKLALWLAAIIAVLLPIRLFENKLVDLRAGGQRKKPATFFNLISFGLWMVSLLISISLIVNVNGLLGLAGGMVAVALILMTQPIRRFQTAKGAYRARRKGVEASSKQSRSRFYGLTTAVGAGLKAFFGRPAATTSTLDEFKLIIEREVKRQKK